MTQRLPVTLFDYGVGNLHSIKKALERSGAEVSVTRDPARLLDAGHIVLPGVGAFGATMQPLLEVRDALRARLETGTPCLAVCIGMQLLYEGSEESPGVPGIGLLRGSVRHLPATVGKIPHMGWNTLSEPSAGAGARGPWRDALPPAGSYVYYVHSFYAAPERGADTLLTTRYGAGPGIEFPAVVSHRNTLATQFHPEKSSGPGLRLVAGWVEAARRLGEAGGQGPKIDTSAEASRIRQASGTPDQERRT